MEFGETLSSFLINYVFPILGAILLILLDLGALVLYRRWGIQLKREDLERIEELAMSAVSSTEEYAADWVNRNGHKLGSDNKKAQAVMWLLEQAPELSREDAEHHIRAALEFFEMGAAYKRRVKE